MSETKQNALRKLRALAAIYNGLSPLEMDTHEKIIRTAIGVLRNDGHKECAEYFIDKMPLFVDGMMDTEKALNEGKIKQTRTGFCQAVTKYDRTIRVCGKANQIDLVINYIARSLYIIQIASTPKISTFRMLLAGDVFDKHLKKRYSPLSDQRAKCDAAKCETAADYVRQGMNSLEMSRFCFSGSPQEKRMLSILSTSLTNAEKLCAGYLRDVYQANAGLFSGEGGHVSNTNIKKIRHIKDYNTYNAT